MLINSNILSAWILQPIQNSRSFTIWLWDTLHLRITDDFTTLETVSNPPNLNSQLGTLLLKWTCITQGRTAEEFGWYASSRPWTSRWAICLFHTETRADRKISIRIRRLFVLFSVFAIFPLKRKFYKNLTTSIVIFMHFKEKVHANWNVYGCLQLFGRINCGYNWGFKVWSWQITFLILL